MESRGQLAVIGSVLLACGSRPGLNSGCLVAGTFAHEPSSRTQGRYLPLSLCLPSHPATPHRQCTLAEALLLGCIIILGVRVKSELFRPAISRQLLTFSLSPADWHSVSLSSIKKKPAFLNSVTRACFPDYLSFQIPPLRFTSIFGFVWGNFVCLCFEG